MNDRVKKITLTLITSIFLILPFFSNATLIAGQPISTNQYFTDSAVKPGLYERIGDYTSISGLSPISSVTFALTATTSTQINSQVITCTNAATNLTNCTGTTTYQNLNTVTAIASSEVQEYEFTFNNAITANRVVFITIYSITSVEFAVQGSNTDVYADGSCFELDTNFEHRQACNPSAFDLFFRVEGNEGVSFILPGNNTSGQDFNNWIIRITDSPATTSIKALAVGYGEAGYSTYIDHATTTGQGSEFQVSLRKNTPLTAGDYVARVQYRIGNILQNQDSIAFTITGSSTPNFIDPYIFVATSTDAAILFDECAASSGLFSYGMCWALVKTIVPSQQSMDNFRKLPDQFRHALPFSILTELNTAWNLLASATASSTTLYASPFTHLPEISGNTLTLFNLSAAAANYPFINLMRTYTGYIIWFTFMLYTIKRILSLL